MRRLLTFLAIFLLGVGTSQLFAQFLQKKNSAPNKRVEVTEEATATGILGESNSDEAIVTRVIDGDTVELSGGRKLRYIGIDTPELVHPNKPVECFAREAKEENQRLVEGKTVRLEKDVSETDKYGRLLRYVYVGEVMVNEYLVRQGFALSSTYPPDVKYQERFLAAEREARENNRGLWAGCPSGSNPTNPTNNSIRPINESMEQSNNGTSGCTIKGNISANGEKIYHIPGCGSYAKTVIDESKGERWFCSEEEAVGAGWRKAKNCP